MKLVNVPLARAIWVFDLARVNAKGRSLVDVFHSIAQRYRFPKFPMHPLDLNKEDALEFNSGTFIKDGVDLRVGFTVYNNGITADSLSSTDNSEAFLEDLAEWLAATHDIHIKPELQRKAYLSQVNVAAEAELPLWNPALAGFPEIISRLGTSIDGTARTYEFGAIMIWPNDAGQPAAPQPFRLEKKWGIKPSEHVYFSQAQMATQEHLRLLNEIEAALLKTRLPAARSERQPREAARESRD